MVLFKNFNTLSNPYVLSGGRRRRRIFIPPSTNFPLFLYGEGDDQRSFLSLIEHNSVYNDIDSEISETASVSTTRSLPSSLSSINTNGDQESFASWLLEEQQRRYSAANSEEDINTYECSDRERRGSFDRSSRLSYKTTSMLSEITGEDFSSLKTNSRYEGKMLFKFSVPLIITFVLENLFSIVSLLVVGHLGKRELAAVSLGSMTSTITFAIFEGIATALDTLCPQAYGAKHYHLVSTHVQRCLVFSYLIYVPCALIWWYSNYFLGYIIDDKKVVDLTCLYLRILSLGAPGYIFFENAKRFLQAQGIFEAGTGILFLSAPVNIGLSWFLVWDRTYGVGFAGAPIATALNFWLMAILLVLYGCFIDGKHCWNGINSFKTIFSQWKVLCHLAIPGIIMLESEYLAYEIMTLFASALGTVELAAQSTVLSVASLTYMLPFSVSIASATRVANFIGGRNVEGARIATRVAMIAAVLVATFNCFLLILLRKQLAILFTDDPDVLAMVIHLFAPLVGVLQIFDGIASVASGILRAQGRQKIGGLINFLSYYALALPLAILLSTRFNFGLSGLWLGIGSGMMVISVLETLVIITSNWEKVVIDSDRINAGEL